MAEKRHPNFKGGKVIQNNYYMIFVGKAHHLADKRGYAYEHRLNAEQKLLRRLKPGEQVHHFDGNKLNNNLDNLVVYSSKAEHFFHHRKKDTGKKRPDEENTLVPCACGCGKTFLKYDSSNRPRRFVSGHNL